MATRSSLITYVGSTKYKCPPILLPRTCGDFSDPTRFCEGCHKQYLKIIDKTARKHAAMAARRRDTHQLVQSVLFCQGIVRRRQYNVRTSMGVVAVRTRCAEKRIVQRVLRFAL